jgi:hypothetical protein
MFDYAFNSELDKYAGLLDLESVEDEIGHTYLSGEQEQDALESIDRVRGSGKTGFILRNPWLTGIPTLGIAPLIASSIGNDRVARSLARKHTDIAGSMAKARLMREEQANANMRQMSQDAAMTSAASILAGGR